MLFPCLGVLFDGILHPDLPAGEELAVHLRDGEIGGVEVIVADEAVAFGCAVVRVPINLGADDHAEVGEGIVECLLVDFGVQIADKKIGSDILGSFVLGGLVDFDGLAIQFDHVHNFDGVVCILLTFELDEPESLMLVGNFIPGNMHIHDWPALSK